MMCALWMWAVVPAVQAEPYLMNDVGGTLTLPSGFEMSRWSDWDFKAKGGNGSIMYKLWLTPYQMPITKETGRIFAESYVDKLGNEGGGDGVVKRTELKTLGGRDVVISEIQFKAKGGTGATGVYLGAAFAGAGQVIHSRVIASSRNTKAARKALESTLASFSLKKGPLKVTAGAVSSGAGFGAVLPDGWREPLEPELAGVVSITSKMWKSELSKDECFVGIHVPKVDEPDVLFACKKFWDGSPVDAFSFSEIETEWREIFFGKAGAELPPGEQVNVGDRVGALFRPRDGSNPIRLLVAPYDGGLMATWYRGSTPDPKSADSVMLGLAPTITFTGPDGGKPLIRPDRWVGYYLSHRPTHPFVLAPVLFIIGGVAFLVRRGRGRNPYEDLDDEV